MQKTLSRLRRSAQVFAFSLLLAAPAAAGPSDAQLAETVAKIESRLNARVGVVLHDSGSGWSWTNRADERFLMNSTFKAPLCGAILAAADAGTLSLDEELPILRADILSYAPVTEKKVGQSMSLSELCLATIDMSDNTAANLLINRLGGTEAVTEFFRQNGDTVSRLDRLEPDMNTFKAGDPRDTTSPAAMSAALEKLLLGDVLSPQSRNQLIEWMSHGGVTGALLRKTAPEGWHIADKSGSGDRTRNIIAMITPPDRAPWIAVIFVSDVKADFATRNAALQEISAAVIGVIKAD
ncbi:Beta-lactamase SHV-1 precursor [Pannonibacter phragmitetus]|uniref:Beta-lactamase n=1 Tax=Pannonibacter phragmitetus TaxID=121719 RepID=A0A378ZTC3_9HYPH|nr:Beta-lactamase SHV-1 precursor [Pannonibacter phragmitetus]